MRSKLFQILLCGRNSAEWVAAFFGCILRGAVAVPMDQGATAEFAGRVAQQVDAKLMLADRQNVLPGEQRPVILFDSLQKVVGRHASDAYDSPSLNRGSIGQIIFTSVPPWRFHTGIFWPTSSRWKPA